MKFPITDEILNGKLNFLCSVTCSDLLKESNLSLTSSVGLRVQLKILYVILLLKVAHKIFTCSNSTIETPEAVKCAQS